MIAPPGKEFNSMSGWGRARARFRGEEYLAAIVETIQHLLMIPPTVAAALASIRHLRANPERRDALFKNAEMLKRKFRDANVPLMIGDATKATEVSMRLIREFGMYAMPINYPTAAIGTERLRFTPGPKHTEAMMDELVAALTHILQPVTV